MRDKIERLLSLTGSDGAFYIVALHSFIEYHMRRSFPDFDESWTITFNTNLYNYKKYLIEQNPGKFLNELSSFKSIMDQERIISRIRHEFEAVSLEEVRAATFNFLQFARASGIDESLLTEFKAGLDQWDHSSGRLEDRFELEKVKNELVVLKKENSLLLDQYREFEEMKAVKKYLESRIETLSLEMEIQKKSSQEQIDQLYELKGEKKQIENNISRYENIDRYLKNLLRVSLYTRSRMDYERSLTELTEEQKDVLHSISLKKDFLVKGGAGTGKTLILLEAMKQANAGTLAFANRKMLLLTYTNTLVKYDRYISDIMNIDDCDSRINTADSYINSMFEQEFPELTIDYQVINQLCREMNQSDFFDAKQLRVEIEDFLLGYNISETEYIGEMISRKGLKNKLSRNQREIVWALKTSLVEKMTESKTVSKAYSRILLSTVEQVGEFDHIFIDESQDLYPVELQILKKRSRISLIMAGDSDQSIYGIGSPHKRVQLTTGKTVRLLRTNFRNTMPIHDLAERFRKKGDSSYDKIISPKAFRDGPVPELYTSCETEELYDLLIEKVKIFVNTIEYDPENICILAPTAKFLGKIGDKLTEAGFSTVNIKDPEFSFKSEGSIRLSPLHSSKGLDLPVVLLFIPILFYNRELEADESGKLVRNLIYVSMTRAMENLNIFAKKETSDPVVSDLIELMDNSV